VHVFSLHFVQTVLLDAAPNGGHQAVHEVHIVQSNLQYGFEIQKIPRVNESSAKGTIARQ
jgi:hypothetical protein